MPESMKGIQGGIQTHVVKTGLKPEVVFGPRERDKFTSLVWHLEHQISSVTVLLAVNVHETEDGLDRTEERVLGGGQGNEVLTSTELVIFRLLDSDNNPVVYVVP